MGKKERRKGKREGKREGGKEDLHQIGGFKVSATDATTAKLRLQISRSEAVRASRRVLRQMIMGEVEREKKRVLATL